MPREFKRTDRVAEEIKDLLSDIIHKETRDAGLGIITITDVEVSRDLSHAKVFISLLDDLINSDSQDKSSSTAKVKALKERAPFLRSQLAKRMRIRKVPELKFIYDDTLTKGNHLMGLINKANKKT